MKMKKKKWRKCEKWRHNVEMITDSTVFRGKTIPNKQRIWTIYFNAYYKWLDELLSFKLRIVLPIIDTHIYFYNLPRIFLLLAFLRFVRIAWFAYLNSMAILVDGGIWNDEKIFTKETTTKKPYFLAFIFIAS